MEKPSNGVDILDGYFTCYDDGTIWSNKSNRFVGCLDSLGYVRIQVNGKKVLAHRLIAMAFLGLDLESEMTVDHKNGIKSDNRVCNLEIVTLAENITRARRKYYVSKEEIDEKISIAGASDKTANLLGFPDLATLKYYYYTVLKVSEDSAIKQLRKYSRSRCSDIRSLNLVDIMEVVNKEGSQMKAAKVLGISPSTLSKILKEKRNAYNNPSDSSN